MLADKVDLLIVAAIDGEALTQTLAEAKDQGVPVIAYDRMIKADAVDYYVSFDNYTVGVLQAKYVIEHMDLDNAGDKTYNIEFTAGDPADNNAGYFFNGAYDTLKPYLDAGTLKIPSGKNRLLPPHGPPTPLWRTSRTLWLPSTLTAPSLTSLCAPTTPPPLVFLRLSSPTTPAPTPLRLLARTATSATCRTLLTASRL